MTVATVFKNNQSQAVRLPKAVAFPENVKQVDVQVVGNMRILSPVGTSWEYFFDHVEASVDTRVGHDPTLFKLTDFVGFSTQPTPKYRSQSHGNGIFPFQAA